MRRLLHLFRFHRPIRWLVYLLSAWFISFPQVGAGNILKFDKILDGRGESVNWATSLHQDDTGYLYIGTANGLYIYNGYQYEIYRPDPNDPLSVSNDWISAIFEDRKGNMWFGTRNGLNRFHPESGTFTRYQSQNPEIQEPQSIDAIIQDKQGALWWAVKSGLVKLDIESRAFTHYPQRPFGHIHALHLDQGGIIWAGSRQQGLFSFDPETETFEQYKYDAKVSNSLSSNTVRSIIEDDRGTLWVGTEKRSETIGSGGLNRLNRETKSFSLIEPAQGPNLNPRANDISVVSKGFSGKLWLGSLSGDLHEFDPNTLKVTYTTQGQPTAPEITSLLVDRSGILWVGSHYSHTLSAYTLTRDFNNREEDRAYSKTLSHVHVTAIHKDRQGALWVGTRAGGLNRYDKERNSFTSYQGDKAPGTRISVLYEDRRGTLWVGAVAGGLSRIDPKTNTVDKRYLNDPKDSTTLAHHRPIAIWEDRQDNFWIGHRLGLDLLDRDSGVFTHFKNDPNDATSLAPGPVTCGLEDRNGMLWIGTSKGISLMDPKSGGMRRLKRDSNNPKSLSSNRVRCIYEDVRGTIWVGTQNGLNRYNRDTETFDRYFIEDGLISNNISGALEDPSGLMWFSTTKGISRYDSLKDQFLNYDQNSGLLNSSFEQNAYYKDADGRFYLGGPNGLDSFDPLKLTSAPAPTIAVSAIWNVKDRLFAWHDLLKTHDVEISYKNNDIAFEFAVLDYLDPQRNQYRYRMDGFDETWIDGGNRNYARYTNLSPGEYALHVQGANSRGIWSEQETLIKLTITPLFWQTTWFRLAAALALGAAVYSAHKWITARIGKRNIQLWKANNAAESANKHLKATAAEMTKLAKKAETANIAKTRFLANMSHEVRTPLNGVIGMLSLLQMTELNKEQKEFSSIANSSAHSLLSLLSDILEVSSTEAEEMSVDSVNFAVRDFAQEAIDILQPNASEKGLQLRVDIDAKLPKTLRGDTGSLLQILLNLLMNSIKFTEEGFIDFRLIAQDQKSESVLVRFEVADSGIGIPKEKQTKIFNAFSQIDSSNKRKYDGAGLGLSICKQLVSLMGGEMGVESSEGCGAVFWFTITLARSKPNTEPEQPAPTLKRKTKERAAESVKSKV